MGKLLISVEASAARSKEFELPFHWPELDEDERKEWVDEITERFLKNNVSWTAVITP